MPVPFEALIPYVLMGGLTIFGGVAMTQLRLLENGGKWPRYNSDRWDKQMMDRDRRLTGYKRGQSDKAEAPEGFELSNSWRVQDRIY